MVVLPASIWATMPIFRTLDSVELMIPYILQNWSYACLRNSATRINLSFPQMILTIRFGAGRARIRRFRWSRRRRLFRGLEKLWLLLPLQPIRGKENLASRAAPSKSLRASPSPSRKLAATPNHTLTLVHRMFRIVFSNYLKRK